MAKFLHIHVGDRVTKTVVLVRDSKQPPAPDPDFDRRERWIEALLTRLEEMHDSERGVTHDDGGSEKGHPFYGNQYTDVATGPKPTEAKTKSSVKAALHELLTSGHPFSLDELMAATGSKSKSNLTTAITHLKGANPHPDGVLNVLKNDKGEYHLDPSKPPSLDPYIAKPKAPKPAEPAATPPSPAPAPSAGPSVAKAPPMPMSNEEANKSYQASMNQANQDAMLAWQKPKEEVALGWKTAKAQAMAQWKANTTGLDQKPIAVEVFKEDKDLMADIQDASGDPAKTAMAILKWKETTLKAKVAAKTAPALPPTPPAAKVEPAGGGTPLATPTGPGAFQAPDNIVPDDHKHIDFEDFKSGSYVSSIKHLKNQLQKASIDAVANKKKVQHALDARLKGSHHFQAMEDQHTKAGKSHYNSLAATLIQQWASSSGDGHPVSVAAQLAVRDAFKMKAEHVETKALHALNGSSEDDVHKQAAGMLGVNVSTPEKLASFKEGMKDFALAQYHETQDQFAKLGIKELHLVRGMKVGSSATAARKVNVKLQPASSFSTNHATAANFAGPHSMFAVKVPVSQVLGSYLTGYGCSSEHEVVVLAHESLQAIQVGKAHAHSESGMAQHIASVDPAGAPSAPQPKPKPKPKVPAGNLPAWSKGLPDVPGNVKGPHAKNAKKALLAGDLDKFADIVASTPPGKQVTQAYLKALQAHINSNSNP